MPNYGDTPSDHSKDLCRSCEHALFVEGRNSNESFKRCGWLSPPWPQYPVLKCSSYEDRGEIKRQEMEKIAWIIEVPRKGAGAGFHKADRRKDDEL